MTEGKRQGIITVRRELYVSAPDARTSDGRSQRYVSGDGLRRVEHRSLQRESDWSNGDHERYSDDNGRTWGPWEDVCQRNSETKGDDEINTYDGVEVFNPKYGHFVSVGMRRIFFGGHERAYAAFWKKGEAQFIDHSLLTVRADGGGTRSVELIKYEDGADYDPDDWGNPAHINHNRAYFGGSVDVLDNGEIVFTIAADLRACCRILGLDVREVFPSCPDIMRGMIVVRGTFNIARGNYDLTFSRPVVISDLKSSRGVCEPTAIRLPSGRILAVFRGSNMSSDKWHTRIEPGTPAHKWYCYSDDGGTTFTEPVPWHFDDQEVFYSSATISALFRSIKNRKIYWIGNISDHTASGNGPRYPLIIAEVDDRGLLIKDTFTVIDTREEGDSKQLQLSNFSILQDRETGLIELYLSKLGQREQCIWHADSYRYFIDLESHDQCAADRTADDFITTAVDVLVVGGGAAGTIAAIQAARAGAKTLLVERGTQLGGTTTTGGVAFPGLFDAWGKQIIAGIGWELVSESVQLDGGELPDFSKVPPRHWMNQIKVNQFLYPLLAEEKCEQAGVEIAYYEFPCSILKSTDGWQVDCAGFGTRRRVLCKQIIDCTGGAETIGMLNLPRLRESETQPGSMLFSLGKPYEAGRVGVIDSLYIHGAESTNSRTVTAANLKGRKDLLDQIRSSHERLMHLQSEASFRESYRIVGETMITVDDYTSGRVFDDALCYAFYPVDLHTKGGVQPKPLTPGTVPTIPLRALVPKGSCNIMVAGRSVSSDRLANSGLRVQASCMAMGQAAGVVAALAVQQNTTPLKVPLKDIRKMLLTHGAIVPNP